MSNQEVTSLATEYPKMQAYCRELLKSYQEIGPAGRFGAMMIEQTLREADEAIANGDTVAMLVAYDKMKNHK